MGLEQSPKKPASVGDHLTLKLPGMLAKKVTNEFWGKHRSG
jgi:hypothetical protein